MNCLDRPTRMRKLWCLVLPCTHTGNLTDHCKGTYFLLCYLECSLGLNAGCKRAAKRENLEQVCHAATRKIYTRCSTISDVT